MIRIPEILWAQRLKNIFLTINLPSIDKKTASVELSENTVSFSGKGGSDFSDYKVTLNLFAPIDMENSKYIIEARNVSILLRKKEEKWWKTLIKEGKAKYIKVDWEKWREEDDPEIPGLDFPMDVPDPESNDSES